MNLSSIQQLREELLRASEKRATELEEYLVQEEQKRKSEEVLEKRLKRELADFTIWSTYVPMLTPFTILVVLALIFGILSLIPPLSSWPLMPIAIIFLAVALLIK
jgi:archaellum biogenesis protein FlaJ (TadC family)